MTEIKCCRDAFGDQWHELSGQPNSTAQKHKTNSKAVERHVNEVHQEVALDYDNQAQVLSVPIDSRQILSNPSVIIHGILLAITEDHIEDIPPQQVTYPSQFIVKSTGENRLSIGKDGNGAWIQNNSSETAFALTTNEDYQIIRRNDKGQFHYHQHIGRQYVQCSVVEKNVFLLKRFAGI